MRLGDSEKDYYINALDNPGTSVGAERAQSSATDSRRLRAEAAKEAST